MMRLLSIVAVSLCFCGTVLAQPASPPAAQTPPAAPKAELYKGDKGPYAVGQKDLTLKDTQRGKDLELRVRWPKVKDGDAKPTPGPFPVIIFSHGSGGSAAAFGELSAHWASHGYVTIHPTHSDSTKLQLKDGGFKPGMLDPKEVISKVRPMDRHQDIKLILDSIEKIEKEIAGEKKEGQPEPARIINQEKIGMSGHSAGGLTTEIIYGAKARFGLGSGKSYADPRIKAAIVVSGTGTEMPMFTKDSWSEITGPMMVITGSLDTMELTHQTPETRSQPYELAKPGDKYLIFIEGATHGSYQGKTASRALQEKPTTDIKIITDVTAGGTLAFWDAYLKGDDAAKTYLRSGKLKAFSGNKAEVKHK